MSARLSNRLHLLPPGLAAQLDAYCALSGEEAGDVLADALTLHLDALATPVDFATTPWSPPAEPAPPTTPPPGPAPAAERAP